MFDLEKESTLYVDLAKANSRVKRSRTGFTLPFLECIYVLFIIY